MIFIGDVHANFQIYDHVTTCFDDTFQVGDMGFFREIDISRAIVGDRHKFIRGNHDDPLLCVRHPGYLGDFGYLKEQDIFYLSGGWSIDQDYRTPGIDWWKDEELSTSQLQSAIDEYKLAKPRVVVSHECPSIVKEDVLDVNRAVNTYASRVYPPSRTELALTAMWELHQPEYWIFGHYHTDFSKIVDGTRFVCLEIIHYTKSQGKEFFEIPDLTW